MSDNIQNIDNHMDISSSSGDDDENLLLGTFSLLSTVAQAAVLNMDDGTDSSDQDEEMQETSTWGHGSVEGRENIKRDFIGAYSRLVNNYFRGANSIYTEDHFERRFGVPRTVFNRVYDYVLGKEPFIHKQNAVTKEWGIHPLVRCTAAFRQLVYGDCADRLDEDLQISESSANQALTDFCKLVVDGFGHQYLNQCPSEEDKKHALSIMEKRGFPGAFASWDCKHYEWKNCPLRLAGQHKGKGKAKTLVMEAISDPDLYIWYFYFGAQGSNNDINILDNSSILGSILSQSFNTKVEPYEINGTI